MKSKDQTFIRKIPEPQKTITVETTLYDLIEAVGREANHNEEPWIPLIVYHMLCSVR